MTIRRLRTLRIFDILLLVLLTFQYELGITINLSPLLPKLPPFLFSNTQIFTALQSVGVIGPLHAVLGTLIWLLALVFLILTFSTRKANLILFGVLGFVSTGLEVFTGVMFTLSGFQNDGYSHGMATNFMASVIIFFIVLYLLKPLPKPAETSQPH